LVWVAVSEQNGLGVTHATSIRSSHSHNWRASPTGSQARLSIGAMTACAPVICAISGIISAAPLTSASDRIRSHGGRLSGR